MKFVDPDDPILREVIAPFEVGNPRDLRKLAVAMWELMRHNRIVNYTERRQMQLVAGHVNPEHGIGIAAPQVGERVRMFVVDLRPQRFNDAWTCINPVVSRVVSAPVTRSEGCLTWPWRRANVARSEWIVAEFTDLRGKRQRVEMHGILARAFQHELDHLDGRTIFATERQQLGEAA